MLSVNVKMQSARQELPAQAAEAALTCGGRLETLNALSALSACRWQSQG